MPIHQHFIAAKPPIIDLVAKKSKFEIGHLLTLLFSFLFLLTLAADFLAIGTHLLVFASIFSLFLFFASFLLFAFSFAKSPRIGYNVIHKVVFL